MRQTVRAIIIHNDQLLLMHRNKFGRQYYSLPGGGIDPGEGQLDALVRELHEEAMLTIANPRLQIIEDAGEMYGIQHIYRCDYVSGEPQLAPDSEEAQIHALGKNLFTPLWLPLNELPAANLLPKELKDLLLDCLANGFPDQPLQLTVPD